MGLKNTLLTVLTALIIIASVGAYLHVRVSATAGALADASTTGAQNTASVANAASSAPAAPFVSCIVTQNLVRGDDNADVTALQRVLNMSSDTQVAVKGEGSPGNEGTFFGKKTFNAVVRFQNKYAAEILTPQGFTRGTGMVSDATRTKLNQICSDSYSPPVPDAGQTTTDMTFQATSDSATGTTMSPPTITFIGSTTPASAPSSLATTSISTSTQTVGTTSAPATSSVISITAAASTTNSSSQLSVQAAAKVKTPVATTTPAPVPVPVPAPLTGMQWGAYAGESPTTVSTLDSLVGKSSNLVALFWAFQDGFPSQYNSQIGPKGKTEVIFWEPDFGYDSINDGSNDALMKQFATDAKAYGYPIILAPFNEFNLNQEVWGYGVNGNTAAKFKTAWQRMYNIFKAAGATNVKFALDYNETSVPDAAGNRIADYYPGDAYVDYMAVDGFNFGSPWFSFSQIFDAPIKALSAYNKPVYILSTASAAGTNKAAWITAMGATLKTYPTVAGFIWFNENKEQDWLIDSDSASLAAFKSILP